MPEPAVSEPSRTVPPSPAVRPPAPAAGTAARVRVETDKLTAMYGKFTAVKGVSLAFVGQPGARADRAVGLRQVDLPPHPQPDARAVATTAGSPAGSCSTARTSTRRG